MRPLALQVPLHAIVVAILIHMVWGANPVALKLALVSFPPMWSALLRFVIGIACIVAWAWWMGVRMWPTRGEWRALLVIGALFTLQIGIMNVGFDLTTGAMGSVIIASNPIFGAIFVHYIVAGDLMSARKAVGLVVAMLGTATVLLQDVSLADLDFGAIGNWILLASAAVLGLRLAVSARVLRDIDEVRVAIWQMVISLPVFAIAAFGFETIDWQRVEWPAVAGLLYQGVFVAGLAFVVNFWLMRRYTPSVILSFNFISPVVGVLLSAWLLGDAVGSWLLAGMAMVALGLYLIARRS